MMFNKNLHNGLTLILMSVVVFFSPFTVQAEDTDSECVSNIDANFSSDLLSVEALSDKGLSNVVLQFSDGSEQKFEINDGADKYSLTFSGTGSNEGKTLTGVWIKSGCEKSGDGSGYGLYIPACESGITASITPLIINAEPITGAGLSKNYVFEVTLNQASTLCDISMQYASTDGGNNLKQATITANQNGNSGFADYKAVSGQLLFSVGESSKSVSVPVIQDDVLELEDEAFSVTLSEPVNAEVANATGVGVITREDP